MWWIAGRPAVRRVVADVQKLAGTNGSHGVTNSSLPHLSVPFAADEGAIPSLFHSSRLLRLKDREQAAPCDLLRDWQSRDLEERRGEVSVTYKIIDDSAA